jgi:allene oxide cyclase
MKMNRLPIVAVALAAALMVGLTPTVSGGAETSKSKTIRVVERAANDAVTNGDPNADVLGNVLTFANDVYDRTNTRKVGSDQGYCVRVVVGQRWECSWTTFLKKGSISVQGPFSDSGDSVLAITGGTGAYARARGVMNLGFRNKQGTVFNFVFHLR